MVITPNEASKLTVEEENEIKNLENKVDEAIKSRYKPYNSGGLCLDRGLFGEYGTRIFNQMKKMYEQAGWEVKYESDQRDGDFIRLSPGDK